ncbi:WD repeat containing protein [Parasponia andersonii]|uniref:WD repeat containing protein n=1 Tax=Parasponia andersonii TaxID=3476 RepID=A0A2P5CLP9_PARAD|nr:WD repeat containing protein [Parasponia andersonii]
MGSSNLRDLLTAFSPSMDLFAISTGDGRIKTEFTDMVASEETSIFNKPERERGHLSVDYTCMKWFSLERKKKRKLGSSLLILGTGSGDVLALDVSAGQLKWRVSDCHSGGVSAISFSRNGSCVYTAGSDGMVCQVDSLTGNLLGKIKASTKAISSLSVSPDGKVLATAAGQLKIFSSSDHKKIQKFSGHPGAVRCLIFTEDGKYILSSAAGERYIAVWNVGGGKKQSASCVLAMEHPAVFVDTKCMYNGGVEDTGVYVLAISEIGICYFWFGQNIEELRTAKPTKISISSEDISSKSYKGALPTIFAAALQDSTKPASGQVFVAYGLLVKPSFQKILVHSGTDMKLSSSSDGVLLPMTQSLVKSKKGRDARNKVIALDRANAEDALLPIPKVLDSYEKKNREKTLSFDTDEITKDLVDSRSHDGFPKGKDDPVEMEVNSVAICIEDRLRSLGLLSEADDITSKSTHNSTILQGIDLEAFIPQKKMKAAVLSKVASDACKLLGVLVAMWQSGSCSGKYVMPWIYSILVNHGRHVVSQEPVTQTLNSLFKVSKCRGAALQPLLQLSGRLQLITAQINKATQPKTPLLQEHKMDESDDDDEEEDAEDVLYKEEDGESEISSDDDS